MFVEIPSTIQWNHEKQKTLGPMSSRASQTCLVIDSLGDSCFTADYKAPCPPESDPVGLEQGPGTCMFLQAPYEIFMAMQVCKTLTEYTSSLCRGSLVWFLSVRASCVELFLMHLSIVLEPDTHSRSLINNFWMINVTIEKAAKLVLDFWFGLWMTT